LSTLSASSPCASSTSKEYRKTIMKEIRAGIDHEHWRGLAEVAVVAAEIGTRHEGHTIGVMRQASRRRSRWRIEVVLPWSRTSFLAHSGQRHSKGVPHRRP